MRVILRKQNMLQYLFNHNHCKIKVFIYIEMSDLQLFSRIIDSFLKSLSLDSVMIEYC